jgi:amino acid permease
MLKENNSQKNNKKAIYIGFAISSILYFIVGVCGSLAIYGKHPVKTSNVLDYFSGQWQSPIIGFSNFIYFFMIFPIFPYVSKDQLVSLIP